MDGGGAKSALWGFSLFLPLLLLLTWALIEVAVSGVLNRRPVLVMVVILKLLNVICQALLRLVSHLILATTL